ncbi:type I restriction enzyme, S subunit [Aerococcus sp. 150760013-2]
MTKENEKRVPKLRFKGFTDDWEQRKLNEVSIKITEKNKDNMFVETFTNSAEFGIINQRDYFDKDISNEKNLNTYYIVRNDDFVYNPRISNFAPVGPINRNKLNKTGVMSPLYYVFRTHDINKAYLENYFNSSKWHKFMKLNGDSGARSDRFAIKDSVFNTMPIPYPNLLEQDEIGKFINYVENVIALHQRKLEQLEKLKQALLQQMFPQNDETVPKLRFANFNDEWEQHKLGELGKTKSGTGFPDDEQGGEKGIPFFKVSDMNNIGNEHELKNSNNYVDEEQLKKRNWKPIMNVPAIIFAKVGAAIMLNRKRIVRIPFLLDNNTMAYIFDDSWNSDFGKVLFETIYLPRYAQVGALPSYNGSDINSIKIFVPNKNEQEKIGVFFKALDNLITIHQQKLNYYKLFKQTLLQLMFV